MNLRPENPAGRRRSNGETRRPERRVSVSPFLLVTIPWKENTNDSNRSQSAEHEVVSSEKVEHGSLEGPDIVSNVEFGTCDPVNDYPNFRYPL